MNNLHIRVESIAKYTDYVRLVYIVDKNNKNFLLSLVEFSCKNYKLLK